MSFPELYSRSSGKSSERVISESGAVEGSNTSNSVNRSQQSDKVLVIAHRGASFDYPENSMIAFQKALEMGADMIELDVLLSSDGVPVVFHDSHIDAKTNGTGTIGDYTLSEIREFDAGSWFHKDYADTQIPTLEEVLEWASGRISLNIEIKSEVVSDQLEDGIEEKAANLVKKYGMESHVIFSSFSYQAIEHVKQIDPEIPAGVLFNDSLRKGVAPVDLINQLQADAFHCHMRELSSRWRRSLMENRVPILVYTVNNRRHMQRLIAQGVTGIFTDRPDRLRQVVDASSGH